MSFHDIILAIDDVLWGNTFVYATIIIGIYLTIRSKFFGFKLGYIFKHTLGARKEGNEKKTGTVSPFEAMCVAVGGCVGTGNISGVASAIAVGGPGAVFWMWVWAFFGMTVKSAEVALGSYYRTKNEKGEYFGGPSYYIQKGIGEERGWKTLAKFLAWGYGITFILQAILGSQPYAISEAISNAFNIPQVVTVILYGCMIAYVVNKGVPRVAKVASKLVPFMTIAYVFGGVLLIILNIKNVPQAFGLIFGSAFTGTAATGGFVGAAVKLAVQKGLSRSVNSNEAGQGTSTMIHSSADTVHPVAQGMWGSIEVFIDTIIVCTVTALAILCTGVWTSGLTSVTLSTAAFETAFGRPGVWFIGIMMFLFGITTTGGWFTYYNALINHGFEKNPKLRDKLLKIFRTIYPMLPVAYCLMLLFTNGGANMMWDIVDCVIALPIYFNLIALVLLSGTYFKLLRDYEARWMGMGTVEPEFKYFYDTEPNAEAMAHDKELAK